MGRSGLEVETDGGGCPRRLRQVARWGRRPGEGVGVQAKSPSCWAPPSCLPSFARGCPGGAWYIWGIEPMAPSTESKRSLSRQRQIIPTGAGSVWGYTSPINVHKVRARLFKSTTTGLDTASSVPAPRRARGRGRGGRGCGSPGGEGKEKCGRSPPAGR